MLKRKTMSGKTDDNEWQQMIASYNKWQRVITNDDEWEGNENEWYKEWKQMRASKTKWF